jgi:hypothetical protein
MNFNSLKQAAVSSELLKHKEGLYEDDEGKSFQYKDRITEQEEIKHLINEVFQGKEELSFNEYLEYNCQVSSEMFCSIMSVLHERLPCA